MADEVESMEELAALAGELAHHINNPLAVVIASVSVVERMAEEIAQPNSDPATRDELKEVLTDMQQGLEQIRAVVRRLSDLSYKVKVPEVLLGAPFPRTKT